MKDGIIKEDGTSRLVKGSLPATYDEFKALAESTGVPLDILFNAAGWQQLPTFLNKANLLQDPTSKILGLDPANDPTVDAAFFSMAYMNSLAWNLISSKTSAGAFSWTAPDLFGGKSYKIGVLLIGAGGGGGASILRYDPEFSNDMAGVAAGGASGYAKYFIRTVNPGTVLSGSVGAKGVGGTATTTTYPQANYGKGANGGTTSLAGITALGGNGGNASAVRDSNPSINVSGAVGGQSSKYVRSVSSENIDGVFGGELTNRTSYLANSTFSASGLIGYTPLSCFNPFECERILGSGGGAYCKLTSDGSVAGSTSGAPAKQDDGTSCGNAGKVVSTLSGSTTGNNAVLPGCGGGALVGRTNGEYSAIAGAGADGAVYIYLMGVVEPV